MTSGMTSWQDRAKSFGGAADEYDRMRPGCPPELVDDVVRFASNGAGEALEVGAGTGKATLAFADRGIAVTAVEPDAAMAAVLTSRLAGRANVTVIVSSFEEYVPRKPVGLLFSAQAWHWTDPASRWQADLGQSSVGMTFCFNRRANRATGRCCRRAMCSPRWTSDGARTGRSSTPKMVLAPSPVTTASGGNSTRV